MFGVEIKPFSLKAGKVGTPIDRPPITREHETAEEAMLDLMDVIDSNREERPGEYNTYLVVMDDGRKMPLNSAYKETFGEEPGIGKTVLCVYPRLKEKK